MIGAARLGAPFTETSGLHVAFMGGLGLGVLAVQSIAGLLHAGKPLGFSRRTRLAFLLLVAATMLRILPDVAGVEIPGGPHALASALWAGAFLIWLAAYWPVLSDAGTLDARRC